LSDRQIPERITDAFDEIDRLLITAEQAIEQVDVKGISQKANQTLDSVKDVANRLDGILAHLDQDNGLLSSLDRASDAVGDTLRNADGLGSQLVDTLESVQTAARSIRKLTEAIEQDPDMLLKGRSPERK
jgi:paraquat-inducible protein B